eukprot:TRINITY_DN16480_c0_g1_i1.p1 TRINITY_DN16480_c0_g1~~TRINITY_DN16480_c0_g1_i1.p1  ORF type:complete len:866 (+),score=119.43 TRINITY_DN16480_c0_g1_i1:41-2638(+)
MNNVVNQQGDVLLVSISRLLWDVLQVSHAELQQLSKTLTSMNVVTKSNEGRRGIVEYAAKVKGRMQRIAKLLKGMRENKDAFKETVVNLRKRVVQDSAYRVVADEMFSHHAKLVSDSFGPPRVPPVVTTAIDREPTVGGRCKLRKTRHEADTSTSQQFLSTRALTHLALGSDTLKSYSGKGFKLSGITTPKLTFTSDVLSATFILGTPTNMYHFCDIVSYPCWTLHSWDMLFSFKRDPGSDSLQYKIDPATEAKISEFCSAMLQRGELQNTLTFLEGVCLGAYFEEFHSIALSIARLHRWCAASVDSSTGNVRMQVWGTLAIDFSPGKVPGHIYIIRNDVSPQTAGTCLPQPANLNDFMVNALRVARHFKLLELHNRLTYDGIPSVLEDNVLKAKVTHGCFVSSVTFLVSENGTVFGTNYSLPNGGPVGPIQSLSNSPVVVEHAVQTTFNIIINLTSSKCAGAKSDIYKPHTFIHNGIIHVEMPLQSLRIVLKINLGTLQAALVRTPCLGGVPAAERAVVPYGFVYAAALSLVAVTGALMSEIRPDTYHILPQPFSIKASTPTSAASICLTHAWMMAWRSLSVAGLQHANGTRTVLDLLLSGGLGDGAATLQNAETELASHIPNIHSGHVLVTAVPSLGVYWTVSTVSNDEHPVRCTVLMFYNPIIPDSDTHLSPIQLRKLLVGHSIDGWLVANFGELDVLMTCALSQSVSRTVTDSEKVARLLTVRLEAARKFVSLNEVTSLTVTSHGVTVNLRLDSISDNVSTVVSVEGDSSSSTDVLVTSASKVSKHLCTQESLSEFCKNLSVWVLSVKTLCEPRFLPTSLGRWSLGLVDPLVGQSLVLSDPHIESDIIMLKINDKGECYRA